MQGKCFRELIRACLLELALLSGKGVMSRYRLLRSTQVCKACLLPLEDMIKSLSHWPCNLPDVIFLTQHTFYGISVLFFELLVFGYRSAYYTFCPVALATLIRRLQK